MRSKVLYLFLMGVLLSNISIAQTPQGFNYQAVIRDGSGNPISNHTVSLRLTLQSSSGTPYFSESKLIQTNAQGVINHIVGNGTLISGSFPEIPWGSGDVLMKVEIDPNGGISYVQMGEPTKLQSVPYALYAENTKEVVSQANALDEDPIFVVKNKAGQIVFAVYQTGVRVYVEDTQIIKGAKGDSPLEGYLTNPRDNRSIFASLPIARESTLKKCLLQKAQKADSLSVDSPTYPKPLFRETLCLLHQTVHASG